MRTWILSRWDSLRGTFWFVPLLIVLLAGVISQLALTLDKAAKERGYELTLGWTFTRGPDGSRALLATVAGSMITIASVCFSITIVALQQASSQFGPRLLHNFMRDRGNQYVLGTFIAGFTYCLLILRSVNGTTDGQFVPHLSVTIGLLLALAGVAVLIYFIHHAASSIQAEHVIAGVSHELHDALHRLFPSDIGDEPEKKATKESVQPNMAEDSASILATTSNYLQAVDGDGLLRMAVENDLQIVLHRRPGQFVLRGTPLAAIVPGAKITDEITNGIRNAFYLGTRRTLLQDVEFAIDQLVEIAVRALSPGINDPFTAMGCIDRLGAALVELMSKKFPSSLRYDAGGQLRIIANGVTVEGIVDAAFHQIRQAARTNTAVTIRLLDTIAALAPQVKTMAFRDALLAHAKVIYKESQNGLDAESDRLDVTDRYGQLCSAYALSG